MRADTSLPTPGDVVPALPETLPLTRRQSLFWLDERLYPSAPYHHVVLSVRIRGQLDRARFERAYRQTILAIDQFRLTFVEQGGEPRQQLRADLVPALELVELGPDPEQLTAWIQQRCVRPFELGVCCFDGVLLALDECEHVFYFCQHHIISDGTSVSLFLADLAKRYDGLPVEPRPSYLDYVRHELLYRRSPKAERDARYFATRIGRGTGPLELYGCLHQSRAVGIDRSYFDGGQERWQQLVRVAQDPRVEFVDPSMSRFVALATALFAYLARVTGNRFQVIGTPLPNRSAKFADTCGLIMEQAFLTVELEPGETFASLATKVRSELFGALRHGQHCVSDRGLAYASFNLLRIHVPHWADFELDVELFPSLASGVLLQGGRGDTRDTFGVHILGYEREERLRIGFDFHRATFDDALRQRAKRHFIAVLDALLADLATGVDHVRLLDLEEREMVLALGRGAEPDRSPEDPILRLLRTAAERPTQPAVLFAGTTLSYEQLLRRAGQLAARLRELGVQRGSKVGICLTRGPYELISMLAAWSAGGAYVPLDPTHPADRIRMILEDAAPDVLISETAVLAELNVPSGVTPLQLDVEREALELREPLFETDIDPEQLAYVLFTSGSTGRPKGVAVPRRAIANFLRSMAHTPGMTDRDRLLALTTITFDISGLELHLPLWVGASVQIADRETVLDPARIRQLLESEPITIMQATPTTWRLLLEAGYRGETRRLRMLCGGEAISLELSKRLCAIGELWNMYGPTETTVWSTLKRLDARDERVSIGRPIDNTQVYVLDEQGEVLPLGVVGELCIGGLGVAQGYLGRPDLTASKFVQSRFGAPGDIIYRTGDLARLLPNGELECLGRVDHQVKIRGFRIELGEIESCIRGVPGVRDVVVTAPSSASGEPRLVAYFIGSTEQAVIRERVRAKLPIYMHPSAYVELAEFPLNTNGKVDRKRLPVPSEEPPADALAGAAAASDSEAKMAALFEEVLGLPHVPADRDFFELGGNSVKVIQLRRRVHDTFGIEPSLNAMFDRPTVQRLVAALSPELDPLAPAFVPLRHGTNDGAPLLCIFGVAIYRPLADALDTERPVYGLHIPMRVSAGRGVPSVEEIAARYVELILQKVPEGPYHLAGLCFGGLVAFEVARQLKASGHDVRTVGIMDATLPRGTRLDLLSGARTLVMKLRNGRRAKPGRLYERLRTAAAQVPGLERLRPRFNASDLPHGEVELDVVSPVAQEIIRAYDAKTPKLRGAAVLFRARERLEPSWRPPAWDLGWSDLAERIDVHVVSGSHLDILKPPNVRAIARVLSRSLGG